MKFPLLGPIRYVSLSTYTHTLYIYLASTVRKAPLALRRLILAMIPQCLYRYLR